MEKIKNYLPWTIRLLISFLFLLSAVAKLYPSPYFAISTFEVKQLYPLGFSEEIAPYFSRILIGIELALGILLLQGNFLKKLIIPATLAMLFVFTTHLSIETFSTGGNSGNCGCFGSLLPMTPIEAIIKNVIAMGLLLYLFRLLPAQSNKNNTLWILSTITVSSVLALFMLAPIQPIVKEVEPIQTTAPIEETLKIISDSIPEKIKIDSVVPTKLVKEIVKIKVEEPTQTKSGYATYFPTIDQGKKILCFFVPGCDHCREVAKELTEMKTKDKNFPEIKIIFMNEEADLIPDFFKFAGAEYPYTIIEVIPFWKVLGTGKDTPGVKYLWNGNDYKYYYGITDSKFDAIEFKKIIKKSYSELNNTK